MKHERIDLEKYLSQYPQEMNIIARNLRKMILETVPDMDEFIKWKNLFYEKMDLYVPLLFMGIMLTSSLHVEQNLKILMGC